MIVQDSPSKKLTGAAVAVLAPAGMVTVHVLAPCVAQVMMPVNVNGLGDPVAVSPGEAFGDDKLRRSVVDLQVDLAAV